MFLSSSILEIHVCKERNPSSPKSSNSICSPIRYPKSDLSQLNISIICKAVLMLHHVIQPQTFTLKILSLQRNTRSPHGITSFLLLASLLFVVQSCYMLFCGVLLKTDEKIPLHYKQAIFRLFGGCQLQQEPSHTHSY